MLLEDFLREQHKRIGILKRSLRGEIAKKLFSIQKFLEDIAIKFFQKKGLKEDAELFVFSCSKNQIATKLGLTPKRTQPYILLAAAIGLVKRVNVLEGGGNSEYYGEDGIGIQQYRWELVDVETVRNRWRIWGDRAIRNLNTIQDIRNIFGNKIALSIDTHPEARDEGLRVQEKEFRREKEKELVDELELYTNKFSIIAEQLNLDVPNHDCGYRHSYLKTKYKVIFGTQGL